jgi:hypothetical protein
MSEYLSEIPLRNLEDLCNKLDFVIDYLFHSDILPNYYELPIYHLCCELMSIQRFVSSKIQEANITGPPPSLFLMKQSGLDIQITFKMENYLMKERILTFLEDVKYEIEKEIERRTSNEDEETEEENEYVIDDTTNQLLCDETLEESDDEDGKLPLMIMVPKCIICQHRKVQNALVPCGHYCLCTKCTEAMKALCLHQCPICRSLIEDIIKVYF